MMDFEKLDSYKEHKTTTSDSTERPIGYNSKGAIYPIKNNRTMSAKEYYLTKEWGNPNWDRKTATTFDKSEMFDFAESYAREYHQKEMERKLKGSEELDNQEQSKDLARQYANVCEFKSDFPHDWASVEDGYKEGFKIGFRVALKHLKQRKG